MSIARYWTETASSVRDTRALFAFRVATVRGRSRAMALSGMVAIALVTIGAAVVPAFLPRDPSRQGDVLSVLPGALVTIFVLAVLSAAAAGGGRELLPRAEAVAFPVTAMTDHLGALALAPLNIAWLLQSWMMLGATAYVIGPQWWLFFSQILMFVWLITATSLAQICGWGVEWLRRTRHGLAATRGLTVLSAAVVAALISSGLLVAALDRSPTVQIAKGLFDGPGMRSFATLGITLTLGLFAVLVGGEVAKHALARPARDVTSVETAHFSVKRSPSSDLSMMLRVDRAAIWRSVVLRRGLVVLALMPGLVAIAGDLEWAMVTILPGLVASGGALLFGVNSWCLDGRGALWRDSLPVSSDVVFLSRALVIGEVLVITSVITVAMAAVRAGLPSAVELSAVLSCLFVVVASVVSASMRWSVRHPFAVDLRSPRATPAPPLVMVGYSARLALATTMTGIMFSVLARTTWVWPVLVALPFVLFSGYRLARTARAWADPGVRSLVVTTVAA